MMIDDAIEMKVPEPDSQFLLLPCKCCGGNNVAYIKVLCGDGVERWRVECFDCGFRTAGFRETLHDAQTMWNKEIRHEVS